MEAKAVTRYVRVSPRKARIVLDQIRGKNVVKAQETLAFTNRAVAEIIEKTLNSEIANAGQKGITNPESLYVSACYADEGPTLKRFTPRAKGSASRIRKRTSHITVIVSTREEA